MAVFGGANLGSVSFSSHLLNQHSCVFSCPLRLLPSSSSSSSSSSSYRTSLICVVKSFSGSITADTDTSSDQSSNSLLRDTSNDAGPTRMSSDWKLAKAYCKSGDTFQGEVEGFNGGGLLIRFHSLVGFLPYPQLSPSRSCKEPQKSIHEIAKTLVSSTLPVKIVQADEESKKLILSEKLALWPKYSQNVNVGDVFTGRVGSVEDYGAFIHLRFDDGLYHLTGLVHVSEVSWDYVQDVRDVLRDGDEVRVIVTNIDKEKSKITLSIKQLEDDPLPETLDKARGDAVYVATVPLRATAGPPQLMMSMAYSLNIWNLQHFMVLIKPSSPIRQEVIVFDFQPVNPESIEAAISVLSGKSVPGKVMQRKLKNVPKQRCWMVGSPKGNNNAMEMAIDFNSSWETDLRVGFHDCRHYTNELVQHLNGEIQIVERLSRSYKS